MKKQAHEVQSESTARKSQQCEAAEGLMHLSSGSGSQPREKNLRLLSLFDPLEKSSGNLQGLKRRTRGASAPWAGGRSRNEKCKVQNGK
jgi:hypothetical protein